MQTCVNIEDMSTSEKEQLKKFGRNVAAIRMKREITQQELADITGMATRSIQNIELGERWPRLATLLLISRTLKSNPEDFFAGLK